MQETVLLQALMNTTAIVSYLLENGRSKGDAYKALTSCLETSVQIIQSLHQDTQHMKEDQNVPKAE